MNPSNKEVEELLKKTAGEEVFSLFKILKSKKRVSEIKLAEYCNKKLNEVRGLLYKLYNFNLAFFIKKRNKQTGWYDYYWGINIKQAEEMISGMKKEEVEELKKEFKREEGRKFYICVNKCMRLEFRDACEYNFKCPECNGLMDYEKNNEKMSNITNEIKKSEKII